MSGRLTRRCFLRSGGLAMGTAMLLLKSSMPVIALILLMNSVIATPVSARNASEICARINSCALSHGNPSSIVALATSPETVASRTRPTALSFCPTNNNSMEFKNLPTSESVDTVTLRTPALGKIRVRDAGWRRHFGGTL